MLKTSFFTFERRCADIAVGKEGKNIAAVSAKRVVILSLPLNAYRKWADKVEATIEGFERSKTSVKKDGLLFSVGISKFSSTTWALSTYGKDNNFLDNEFFNHMIKEELSSGIHKRPQRISVFYCTSLLSYPVRVTTGWVSRRYRNMLLKV
ncbi:hypothetical protein [Desulfosporosinus sp. SB140]|uniref:hypothetical protein n=1 Tax=Desulfosporosinus paludis TaxID=3115649 RepID=UPI00388EBAA8